MLLLLLLLLLLRKLYAVEIMPTLQDIQIDPLLEYQSIRNFWLFVRLDTDFMYDTSF